VNTRFPVIGLFFGVRRKGLSWLDCGRDSIVRRGFPPTIRWLFAVQPDFLRVVLPSVLLGELGRRER